MSAKIDLKNLSLSELETLVVHLGEKPYRAKQIARWLYVKGVDEFDAMTDLSQSFRQHLQEVSFIGKLVVVEEKRALDGTRKFLFRLADGRFIESVIIREPKRLTLCISTQVGCRMGCQFCHTATMGLIRHLQAGEIIDQILQARKRLTAGETLTNLVFMGMGEPLDNYANTVKALRTITHPEGLGMSPRRITVSTSGLVPAIKAFGQENLPVNLAVSLNASEEGSRTRLMPVNKKYTIQQLLQACREYPLPRSRRITFEYVLLAGVNDSLDDAKRIAKLLRGIRCKINLIPFNEVEGLPFNRPSRETVLAFQQYLQEQYYSVFIRESRGQEILAACGQLAVPRAQQEALEKPQEIKSL